MVALHLVCERFPQANRLKQDFESLSRGRVVRHSCFDKCFSYMQQRGSESFVVCSAAALAQIPWHCAPACLKGFLVVYAKESRAAFVCAEHPQVVFMTSKLKEMRRAMCWVKAFGHFDDPQCASERAPDRALDNLAQLLTAWQRHTVSSV